MRTVKKYFDKETLPYFEKGSFKFGTLVEYRNGEEYRMTDANEGRISQTVNFSAAGRYIDRVQLGGVLIEDCFGGSINACVNAYEVNDWIFCCSAGKYDKHHHRAMLKRNSDLTHYAELDLDQFMTAISNEVAKFTGCKTHPVHPNVVSDIVTYDERDYSMKVRLERGESSKSVIFDSYALRRMVFNKPRRYKYEKEVRIVVRTDPIQALPKDAGPLFLQSDALRNCILRTGSITD